MTSPLSKKLSEMAEKHVKDNGFDNLYDEECISEIKNDFSTGFKSALDLPEIKQLVEALEDCERYFSHASKNNLLPDGVVQASTLTVGALRQWKSFTSKEGE